MKIPCLIYAAAILILAASSLSFANESERIAVIANTRGDVMIKNPGGGSWAQAKTGDALKEGSFVRTGARSTAVIDIDDGKTATVDLSEKSLVLVATLIKDGNTGLKKTLLDLSIGQVLIKAEKLDTPDSKFEVKTPTSVVGVRGTKFSVKVDALK
jgi:hypothetical protein